MMNMSRKEYWETVKKYATERQQEFIDASHLAEPPISQCQAAEKLGIDRRGVDRGIATAVSRATKAGAVLDPSDDLRVLLLDIETAPIMAHIWQMWTEVRNTDQLLNDWYIMSYAYKWLDNENVYGKTLFEQVRKPYRVGTEDDSELIDDLWELLNEADIVVAHNGDNFDLKKIKARMVVHREIPPAPYRTVDTLKICKREFNLTSNKLDHVHKMLYGHDGGKKGAEEGLSLWQNCLRGYPPAWLRMAAYNKRDVTILEDVYRRIRAWDRSHPNVVVNKASDVPLCTVCGSDSLTMLPNTHASTNISVFDAYRCDCCGHVMRGRNNKRDKATMKEAMVNAR